MNRVLIFIILPFLILLLVSYFQPAHAANLYGSDKDLAGIAESNPEIYQQMIDAGAKLLIMKEQKPFIVYWIPEGFYGLSKRRILVVMHGNNGNAYRHLSNFLDMAKKHRFGILSVQWGWPTEKRTLKDKPQYRYIRDSLKTYDLIKAGLTYLDNRYTITQGECAWLGFSRSSTQCVVFAHLDKNKGKKYFTLFIATSGGIGRKLPIMRELLSRKHGDKPLTGQHFYLWGGKQDRSHGENMRQSQPIIEGLGGKVDILRIGKEGHGGFNHNRQYQEEAWALWDSLCFEEKK
ncbi:MAG: hypothetical protein JRJ86_07860 [Deltaproteobacteria bacterium]|nr:hypothetical protein [Deltaproteobacteria bacterium]MBW2116753.1 hypothetical protein [Deltaproteobacteria bacterium]MBW2343539.1 hypothetical protein [Deltaproteobacteria bacterium]